MFCNFDIFSLMFMEMQRIRGFVLGKLNNVPGQNSLFQLKQLRGKKKREKIVLCLVTVFLWGVSLKCVLLFKKKSLSLYKCSRI